MHNWELPKCVWSSETWVWCGMEERWQEPDRGFQALCKASIMANLPRAPFACTQSLNGCWDQCSSGRGKSHAGAQLWQSLSQRGSTISFYKLPINHICFFIYSVHIGKHILTIPSEETWILFSTETLSTIFRAVPTEHHCPINALALQIATEQQTHSRYKAVTGKGAALCRDVPLSDFSLQLVLYNILQRLLYCIYL